MFVVNLRKYLAVAPLAIALTIGATAEAETRPNARIPADAMMADPNSLYRLFAGRTADWGGGSAAYWAPDGTFRAVNASEQSLGYGTWHVTTASRMCYSGTWSWRQDFGVESREVSVCTRYAIDGDGQVWSTTEGLRGPWFPFFDDNLQNGDSVSASFNAMVRTLGIPTDG